MSVSLSWQPIRTKSLEANGNSTTKDALERAFGAFPLKLGSEAIAKLEGLAAGDPHNPAYGKLIEAITEFDVILVCADY